MWSDVVVVDLVARNDRGFGFLQATHDFLSISDFSVESLHLVIIHVTLDSDTPNVLSASLLLHRVVLLTPSLVIAL